jgi:hypothetical protein
MIADKGWNKQVSSPAEYFVAKDVSESGKSIFIAGTNSRKATWGTGARYGCTSLEVTSMPPSH